MRQLITPNPNIPCKPGWCLAYVNEAFGVPKRFGSATAAWNGSSTKHRDHAYPDDAWVPLWFSLATEPNGHVVLREPGGAVWSTTHPTSTKPTRHPDLNHLYAAYARYNPVTYLGWTEDVEGTPVVAAGGINLQSGTTITPLKEDDMSTPEDTWNHPLDLDGQSFTAGDILVYARKNAADAKDEAKAAKYNSETAAIAAQQAPALAVQTLLATKLPTPDGSAEYTIADYITYGWWYAMQAKDKPTGAVMDSAAIAAAVQVSAAEVASRLELTVKESK